eukprot:4899512-Pleurochrysis_carterae.AAC.1
MGVAKRYTAQEHLRWMLRSCNMTGQHALSGRGYNREGYADSVYGCAGGWRLCLRSSRALSHSRSR